MARAVRTRLNHAHRAAGAATVLVALLLLGPSRAEAIPPSFTDQLATEHFLIHYITTAGDVNAITPEAAQTLATNAERVLAEEQARFGFPAPLPDADAKVDVYVYSLVAQGDEGIVGPRNSTSDSSSAVIFLRNSVATRLDVIAHEVFHVLQDAIWTHGGNFLSESTATWAQLHLYPDQGYVPEYRPKKPLDCADPAICDLPGYRAWSFFEFLTQRYGEGIIRTIYDQAVALRAGQDVPSIAAVEAVLAGQGTTLAQVFRDFSLANIRGDYSLSLLHGNTFAGELAPGFTTGSRTAKLRRRAFRVDHLATQFVEVVGPSGRRCRPATLELTFHAPNIPDLSVAYAPRHGRPGTVPLLNGAGRLKFRHWTTCTRSQLGVALINASTGTDAQRFTVTGKVTVIGSGGAR